MPNSVKSEPQSQRKTLGAKPQEKPLIGTIKAPAGGEPVYLRWNKKHIAVESMACCDCGLVHLMAYEPRKTYLRVRAWRDERRTREMRRIRRMRRKPA